MATYLPEPEPSLTVSVENFEDKRGFIWGSLPHDSTFAPHAACTTPTAVPLTYCVLPLSPSPRTHHRYISNTHQNTGGYTQAFWNVTLQTHFVNGVSLGYPDSECHARHVDDRLPQQR